MGRTVGHLVHDILEAIERVELLTHGKTLDDFQTDWRLRWPIERAIEIISEASRGIPDNFKSTRPEIPWPAVRAIGNVLRHEYEGLSPTIIWRVVTDELPRLKLAIETMRNQLPK